jgi:hypothetical protein
MILLLLLFYGAFACSVSSLSFHNTALTCVLSTL